MREESYNSWMQMQQGFFLHVTSAKPVSAALHPCSSLLLPNVIYQA